jgi:hypothetical protein
LSELNKSSFGNIENNADVIAEVPDLNFERTGVLTGNVRNVVLEPIGTVLHGGMLDVNSMNGVSGNSQNNNSSSSTSNNNIRNNMNNRSRTTMSNIDNYNSNNISNMTVSSSSSSSVINTGYSTDDPAHEHALMLAGIANCKFLFLFFFLLFIFFTFSNIVDMV